MAWFDMKTSIPTMRASFLRGTQHVRSQGKGVDTASLPPPWQNATYFIQKYITCEGRFTVLFHYHFMLLSHLHHGHLINLPYFLLQSLKHMAISMHSSKYPETCITNNGLIKLLVMHALECENKTWLDLIAPLWQLEYLHKKKVMRRKG